MKTSLKIAMTALVSFSALIESSLADDSASNGRAAPKKVLCSVAKKLAGDSRRGDSRVVMGLVSNCIPDPQPKQLTVGLPPEKDPEISSVGLPPPVIGKGTPVGLPAPVIGKVAPSKRVTGLPSPIGQVSPVGLPPVAGKRAPPKTIVGLPVIGEVSPVGLPSPIGEIAPPVEPVKPVGISSLMGMPAPNSEDVVRVDGLPAPQSSGRAPASNNSSDVSK